MIRLYGRTQGGNDSWARVTWGIKGALEELGLLAGFCPVADEVADLDEGMPDGFDAPVGVYIGPPANASVMRGRGDHKHRLAIIAANSTWLPDATMATLPDFVTGLIAPSAWSAAIIGHHVQEKCGGALAVYGWQHGVSAAFCPGPPGERDAKLEIAKFDIAHLASGSKERKGTLELVDAWLSMSYRMGHVIAAGPRLRLVMDTQWDGWEATIAARAVLFSQARDVRATPRINHSEEEAASFYREQLFVVQPSRAEGFGMVPLEALACGVPVIATACTGHGEYLYEGLPGAVIIRHGDYGPIDDGPDALAPTVEPSAIAEALTYAWEHRDALTVAAQANAAAIGQRCSWRRVTEKFLAQYGEELGLR